MLQSPSVGYKRLDWRINPFIKNIALNISFVVVKDSERNGTHVKFMKIKVKIIAKNLGSVLQY